MLIDVETLGIKPTARTFGLKVRGDSMIGKSIVDGDIAIIERQRRLVETGASQTMKSRHLTGHAVDLAAVIDGDVMWDWPLYERLANVMKAAANELGVQIELLELQRRIQARMSTPFIQRSRPRTSGL